MGWQKCIVRGLYCTDEHRWIHQCSEANITAVSIRTSGDNHAKLRTLSNAILLTFWAQPVNAEIIALGALDTPGESNDVEVVGDFAIIQDCAQDHTGEVVFRGGHASLPGLRRKATTSTDMSDSTVIWSGSGYCTATLETSARQPPGGLSWLMNIVAIPCLRHWFDK